MKKYYTDSKTGFNYFFNQEKLIKSYEKYISNHKITKKQLNEEISEILHITEETVRKHISNRNSPSLIDHIYEYGDFLEGDRYIFLELRETEESFSEKAQDILSQSDFVERCIQAVRSGVVSILAEYAPTKCYTSFYQKNAIDTDSLVYYRKKVDSLEVMIMKIHKNKELVKSLFDITTIIKKFICSAEYPGITKEWYKINPNLKFYSPAFELMFNAPKAYKTALKNNLLDYRPSEADKNEYIKYFAELERDNQKNNYHYNENDFFQRELLSTVDQLFKNIVEKTN